MWRLLVQISAEFFIWLLDVCLYNTLLVLRLIIMVSGWLVYALLFFTRITGPCYTVGSNLLNWSWSSTLSLFCLHKLEIIPPLIPFICMRSCPTMEKVLYYQRRLVFVALCSYYSMGWHKADLWQERQFGWSALSFLTGRTDKQTTEQVHAAIRNL